MKPPKKLFNLIVAGMPRLAPDTGITQRLKPNLSAPCQALLMMMTAYSFFFWGFWRRKEEKKNERWLRWNVFSFSSF